MYLQIRRRSTVLLSIENSSARFFSFIRNISSIPWFIFHHNQIVPTPACYGGVSETFCCQCGRVVGNLRLKRPLWFGWHFQRLWIFFYTTLAGANISYTCTHATDKGERIVCDSCWLTATANQSGFVNQERFHFTLVIRIAGDLNRSKQNSSCFARQLEFAGEFTTVLSAPQLQMRRWQWKRK